MHAVLRAVCANPALKHKTAIVEKTSSTTYDALWQQSTSVLRGLRKLGVGAGDVVCVAGDKTAVFPVLQLGVWRAGAAVCPLHPPHPAVEQQHYVDDSQCKLVVTSENKGLNHARIVHPGQLLAEPSTAEGGGASEAEVVPNDSTAIIFYTSGTSGKPKGVVTSHFALQAMTAGMVQSWEWTSSDRILHFLPLHHVHGNINKLLTPLSVGAQVEFTDFEAGDMWSRLETPDAAKRPTVFMGVPTVFAKLIEHWEAQGKPPLTHARSLRVYVCGSAALPVHLFDVFREATGHDILERWGMTEVGMGLSNPLHGKRIPGYVGLPMPGIDVRLADLDAQPDGSLAVRDGEPGDLLIRGDSVFQTYWGAAAPLTEKEFTPSGYFKTGDVAVFDPQLKSYKIVGRKSVDVIKSGGFKISALEIERELLACPDIVEAYVVGIPDQTWGEIVGAVVRVRSAPGSGKPAVDAAHIQAFAAKRLASYKIPRKIFITDNVPKNAMGKVNKKALRALFAV